MIALKTGVPGSGKTLTAVSELVRVYSVEGSQRPLYVHGIPDLALPYIPLPVFNAIKSEKSGAFTRSWEVDWSAVPDGALIVIDEAQQIFPVRGAGSAVPGYVSFLNVHRHRGIDIVLITQGPKLIDNAVRKLVGKHQHYRRLFGGQRHMCYEWDSCSEALSFKLATISQKPFPKKVFAAYKSAEVHTKQKFSIPLFLAVPVLAVGVLGFAGYKLFGYYRQGGISSKPVASVVPGQPAVAVASASSGVSASASSPGASAASRSGPVAASGDTAPPGAVPGDVVGEGFVPVRNVWPASVGGCWAQGSTCLCVINEQVPRVVEIPLLCSSVAFGVLGVHPDRPRPVPYSAPRPKLTEPEGGQAQPSGGADASEARPA